MSFPCKTVIMRGIGINSLKKFCKWKTQKKVNMWITDLIEFFRKTVITRGINFFSLTVQSSLITRTWTGIIFHKMKKLNEKILKFFLIFWFFYPFTLVKFVKMENSKSVKWKLKKRCGKFYEKILQNEKLKNHRGKNLLKKS